VQPQDSDEVQESQARGLWNLAASNLRLQQPKHALFEAVARTKRELELNRQLTSAVQVTFDDASVELLVKSVVAQARQQADQLQKLDVPPLLSNALCDGRLSFPQLKAYMIEHGMDPTVAAKSSTCAQLFEAGLKKSEPSVELQDLENELRAKPAGWTVDGALQMKRFYVFAGGGEAVMSNIEVCLPSVVPISHVSFMLFVQNDIAGEANELRALLHTHSAPNEAPLSHKVLIFTTRSEMLAWLAAYQAPPHTESEVEHALFVWRTEAEDRARMEYVESRQKRMRGRRAEYDWTFYDDCGWSNGG